MSELNMATCQCFNFIGKLTGLVQDSQLANAN